jgi:transcription elongation factor Elf1
MMFQETFDVLRFVNCSECGVDDGVEMSVIVDGTLESAEWACTWCNATNEYRHDTVWDLADEAHDRMKEGW